MHLRGPCTSAPHVYQLKGTRSLPTDGCIVETFPPQLAASMRSRVATTQHDDHEFPTCAVVCPDRRDKRWQPNISALSLFQKDVTTRKPHQLIFKASSLARTADLSFYSEGLWHVVGKTASRRDRPSGINAALWVCMHREGGNAVPFSVLGQLASSLCCHVGFLGAFTLHTPGIRPLCAYKYSNIKSHCIPNVWRWV